MKIIMPAVAFALLVVASSAFAAVIYPGESAFLGAISPGFYLEEFSGWTVGAPIPDVTGPITDVNFGPGNGYAWHAHSLNGSLFSNTGALSTALADEASLLITFTGLPVTAMGGIFTFTDSYEQVLEGNFTLTLNDGTLISQEGSHFIGFTSTEPLTSMIFTTNGTGDLAWPQLDHFYIGAALPPSSVPEPTTFILLAAGIGGLALLKTRRRSR